MAIVSHREVLQAAIDKISKGNEHLNIAMYESRTKGVTTLSVNSSIGLISSIGVSTEQVVDDDYAMLGVQILAKGIEGLILEREKFNKQ